MKKLLLFQIVISFLFFISCNNNENESGQNSSGTNISCDKWLIEYRYCGFN